MKRSILERELERIAERLEAGDDPKEIARELRRIAKPRRGRPAAPPLARVGRRLRRAMVARAIHDSKLPADLAGGRELAVARAAGSWTEADALAGELLGDGAETVARDRRVVLGDDGRLYPLGRSREPPTDESRWEEFLVLMERLGFGPRVRRQR